MWIKSGLCDPIDGRFRHFCAVATLFESQDDQFELQFDNLSDLFPVQGRKDDYFVDAVEKLRSDGLLQQIHQLFLEFFHGIRPGSIRHLFRSFADQVRPQVGGHDDDGIFEIDGSSLVVCQSAIIEHLKQNIENIRMRLFDLIKKQYGIGFSAHGFGQLSAFVVTHISRRRANQSGHREFLLVFRHVDPCEHILIIE